VMPSGEGTVTDTRALERPVNKQLGRKVNIFGNNLVALARPIKKHWRAGEDRASNGAWS
jgi:hypothetical protein